MTITIADPKSPYNITYILYEVGLFETYLFSKHLLYTPLFCNCDGHLLDVTMENL